VYLEGAAGGQVSINDNDLRNNAKGSVHVAPVGRAGGNPLRKRKRWGVGVKEMLERRWNEVFVCARARVRACVRACVRARVRAL